MSKPVTPFLAVDCVAFNSMSKILVIKRKFPPFKGMFALPGGFVDVGEKVEDACRREMREETCVDVDRLYLFGVFSDPGRDPRGHTVSIAFATLLNKVSPVAGDDASEVKWLSDWSNTTFAFDHKKIIQEAYQFMRREHLIYPDN